MSFGPMEFAAYLDRKDPQRKESAAVSAARDAAPVPVPVSARNQLTIISGPGMQSGLARSSRVGAVSVYEAVAMRAPSMPPQHGPVRVTLRRTGRPVVLVLSSHQTVEWQLDVAPDAELAAVLTSGYG